MRLIARTQLPSDGQLQFKDDKCIFEFEMPAFTETTGYFMAHLLLSSDERNELDVFVQVEEISAQGYISRVPSLYIKPKSFAIQKFMKSMHNWQIGLGRCSSNDTLSLAFHQTYIDFVEGKLLYQLHRFEFFFSRSLVRFVYYRRPKPNCDKKDIILAFPARRKGSYHHIIAPEALSALCTCTSL